jgi:hypothetical protein
VAVLSMSKQEFSRLDRLRVSDACVLIGLQRRQGVSSAAGPQAGRCHEPAFQAPRLLSVARTGQQLIRLVITPMSGRNKTIDFLKGFIEVA